jgi:hypothetical protein
MSRSTSPGCGTTLRCSLTALAAFGNQRLDDERQA